MRSDHGLISTSSTSGSTATPVVTLGTTVTRMMWSDCTLRQHLWAKRDFSGKLCSIRACGQQGEFANDNWGLGTLDIVHTGPAATLDIHTSVEEQTQWLIEQNPDYLLTYPSVVVALVEHFRQQSLQDDYAFQNLGSTPPSGDGSYEDRSYARQSVDGSRPLTRLREVRTFGEVGRVVITTLQNFAMPLIRYDIGDYAEVGPPCSCGRGLPVLRRILGRKRNMFILPSGQRRWPCMDTNGQPDYLDAGPLQAADNDLVPVNLAFIQNGLPQSKLEKLRIGISGNTGNSPSGNYSPGSIKLWDSVTKNNLIEPETTWQANALPGTLYMESVSSSGAAGLVLVLEEIEEESGSPGYSVSLVHFDYVQVTSISLDLDIDSDNSNGFNWPDNSEWEEFLEDNPYGLGKLVMQNMYTSNPAQNFTPMRLRLTPGLDLDTTNLRTRLDFENYSDAGLIALWTTTMSNPNRSPMDVIEGGHLISNGTLYTLSQLNYDPIGGGITIFIAGVLENTAIKTMRGVELFGKPQEYVQATLVHSAGGSSIDIFSDRVKYIVTQEDSFFYALQWDTRVLQGLSASLIYDRIDSIDFCMELMGDQELHDTGVENQSIRGMLTERDLASGFNAGLYRHYLGTPTFEYVAAFAGTEPEFPDILTDLMQGIGLTTTQYRNAMDIGNYFKTEVAEIQIRLTNTGHSLGGGLASAAYVGGGARAVTFNSAGLTVAQLFDFYPTSNPNPGPIERIPGSYSRYQNPLMVDAYYVANHDLLSFLQDITPLVLPSALGNRFPLNGPYHVDGGTTVALAAIAAATFPSINTFWPLALAVTGTDGMIG